MLTGELDLWMEILAKGGLIVSAPLMLLLAGFWTDEEIAWLKRRLGMSERSDS